jgi:hypothetical protein
LPRALDAKLKTQQGMVPRALDAKLETQQGMVPRVLDAKLETQQGMDTHRTVAEHDVRSRNILWHCWHVLHFDVLPTHEQVDQMVKYLVRPHALEPDASLHVLLGAHMSGSK